MKTIIVVNQKGGVGKTTIADELAFGLERRGYKVCFQNLDPQGGVIHLPSMQSDDDDFRVVDTPPQLTQDFQNMCRKSDVIILPTSASTLEAVPLQRCYEMAKSSKTKAVIGIALNNYDDRRKIDRDFKQFLENAGMPVWATIPTSTALRQAQALKKSVYDYKKNNPAAAAFEELADKVLEVLK